MMKINSKGFKVYHTAGTSFNVYPVADRTVKHRYEVESPFTLDTWASRRLQEASDIIHR